VPHGIAFDIAICIIAAWLIGLVCQALRQPLLIAYLVAGFAIGPDGLRFVTEQHSMETISQIGLSLLLFMIGLEMDLKKMLGTGRVITVTAMVQIVGCAALAWAVFGFLGPAQNRIEAIYLAVACAMSSTVIIIKLLHDKRELETLPGRITLGVMVLQDLATILFLAIQPSLSEPALKPIGLAFMKVALLVGVAYAASRFVLPRIFRAVARQPELVLVGALAWCFAIGGFARWLGLSQEMGALIAGVMVSTFPYATDVVAKVTNIRDFFVTLFFVALGMAIPIPTLAFLGWTFLFCVVLVAGRFLTVFPVLHRMRLGHRVSFLPAVNLSQLSELSLVVLTIGKAAGEVSENTFAIAALSFAALAVLSTYGILQSGPFLQRVSPWLTKLGFPDLPANTGDTLHVHRESRIFLLGFSWTASSLLEEITRTQPALLSEIMIVDFNPVAIEKLRQRQVRVTYGDISQRETLAHAGVGKAEVIVCSLPDTVLKGLSNRKLLSMLRELNPGAQIIMHAEKLADAEELYLGGATYVSTPRLLEAHDLLEALVSAKSGELNQQKSRQVAQFVGRNEIIP
jgi:Kef-type K+ transport system membrane component KefB